MEESDAGQRGAEEASGGSQVIVSDVQPYVQDAHYPATKEELLQAAEEHCAPEEVMDRLRGMPDKEYASPPEVNQAISLQLPGEQHPQKPRGPKRSLEDRRRGIHKESC